MNSVGKSMTETAHLLRKSTMAQILKWGDTPKSCGFPTENNRFGMIWGYPHRESTNRLCEILRHLSLSTRHNKTSCNLSHSPRWPSWLVGFERANLLMDSLCPTQLAPWLSGKSIIHFRGAEEPRGLILGREGRGPTMEKSDTRLAIKKFGLELLHHSHTRPGTSHCVTSAKTVVLQGPLAGSSAVP